MPTPQNKTPEVDPLDEVAVDPDVSRGDFPDDSDVEPNPIVSDEVPTEPVAPAAAAPAVATPAAKTQTQGMDENRAKRTVVLNALRNSPSARALFARRVRSAYRMSNDFKASDEEILRAGFDLQRESIPDLTPREYEKAIHDEYGEAIDRALLQQGHIDYPGHKDEQSLINEMYKRKIAREEMGPLSTADKAMIVARRFPALNDSNMPTDKALKLRYTEEKKRGRNVGSFEDWLHAQMAPTLAENMLNLSGSIAAGLGEQVKQVGRTAHAFTPAGSVQISADIAAAMAGNNEAKQRLREAGMGAATIASIVAGGALGPALKAAQTAPALAGAAEGIVGGALQGGSTAAIQGKPMGEIAQEAVTNAAIGGTIGGVLGGAGGAIEARKVAATAAREAEELAAAKAAGAGEIPPPAPVVPAPPPVTDVAELAARHRSEVGFAQVVKQFADKNGMDPADVVKLVAAEKPAMADLAAAATRHGVSIDDINALRAEMPEHLKALPPTESAATPSVGPTAAAPEAAPSPTVSTPTVEAAPPSAGAATAERGVLQSDISERMTEALNKAQGQLGERRRLIREQLSQRLAAARERYGAVGGGLAGWREKLRMMTGEMRKPDWEGVASEFSDVNRGALHDAIASSALLEGDKLTAHAGLERLWNGTRMGAPTASQIRVLRMAFGSEFAEAATRNKTLSQKLALHGMKALNTPRTIMSSLDLSAGMRQGYLMTTQPEWGRAWTTMAKSFGDERVAKEAAEAIKTNPKYDVMRESGLHFQGDEFRAAGDEFGARSEVFAGSYVDHWAGIKQSQRAYDTFINKLRSDVFSRFYDDAVKTGVDVTDPEFRQSLAHWINTSTGRGSNALLGRDANILNAVMFSPRLAWSRLETFNPWYYKGLHPSVRAAAIKANATTIGASMSLLGLLAGSGIAAVTWDPRSSDFAKARVGNTRIDLLGGHQQYGRAFAQLISGKVISSTTGREIDLNGSDEKNGFRRGGMTRLDVLSRFFEAKASPIASLTLNMLRGKDGLDRPISMPNEIATRMTPMPIQDIADAMAEGGWGRGALVAPLALTGVGTQTYTANLPIAAGGKKESEQGVLMNAGHWLWNRLNGVDDSPTELTRLTPQISEQWVKDAAAAQVMAHHEASQNPNFFDKDFDQKSEIRKVTARRMRGINKLYKDLMGGNGEEARLAAEKNLLQRRAEATGMDPAAIQNPRIYSEVSK